MVAQKIISFLFLGIVAACTKDVNVEALDDVKGAVINQTTVVSSTKGEGHLETAKSSKGEVVKQIVIKADPYMTADFNQFYALLFVRCNFDQTMGFDLRSFPSPPVINKDGLIVGETGEVMYGNYLSQFWQNPSVAIFFDGAQIPSPPMYKTITKQILVDGRYETRSERHLINKPSVLATQHFLPSLKTAKTMRIDYGQGIGPSFDLVNIKADIEILEAQCVPKDTKL